MIRKALQRVASIGAQKNIERWSRLLKKAEKGGHIQLRNRFKQLSGTMVNNHKLLVQAKWYRLTKALLKNSKEQQLTTLGRWRKLINGIRAHSEIYDRRTHHLRICAKWRKMATILVSKQGKERSMEVLGRWRRLIRNWQ